MTDIRTTITQKYAAMRAVLDDFGMVESKSCNYFEVPAVADDHSEGWFVWIGDEENNELHGEGETKEGALADLDRNLTERMRRAAERLISTSAQSSGDK